MNHKNTKTAITVVVLAIALSAAALTLPTRHALAWGIPFGNSIIVDQRIHQLNECSSPSDNTYKQSSYDMGHNKPSTASTGVNSTHYTSSNSGEDSSDKFQPNNSGGGSDYKNNNKPSKGSTLCFNSGSNTANIG